MRSDKKLDPGAADTECEVDPDQSPLAAFFILVRPHYDSRKGKRRLEIRIEKQNEVERPVYVLSVSE